MPKKNKQVSKLRSQVAVLKSNIRNEPFKVRISADPPAIVSNPKRQQTVEIKLSGPAIATTGQQVVDAIKSANGLADTTNLRVKIIQVSLYGPVTTVGRVTLTDALTGLTISDQGTLARRASCAMRYPLNVSPTIDTSSSSVTGILVNGIVEGASESAYGIIRVNLQWRSY